MMRHRWRSEWREGSRPRGTRTGKTGTARRSRLPCKASSTGYGRKRKRKRRHGSRRSGTMSMTSTASARLISVSSAGAQRVWTARRGSALVVTGTNAGPSSEVLGAGEPAHVDADLRDDRRSRDCIDPRDSHQALLLRGIRCHLLADPVFDDGNVAIDRVQATKLCFEQEAVPFLEPPLEREGEIEGFLAELPSSKRGQFLRIRRSGDERSEHQHPGRPEDIRRYARELDVRRFEQLEKPVPLGG